MVTRELTCKELVELVTEFLEGSLPGPERRRFKRHIAKCDGCSAYLDQIRQVISTLGKLTEDSISPQARDELLHAFRDWKAA